MEAEIRIEGGKPPLHGRAAPSANRQRAFAEGIPIFDFLAMIGGQPPTGEPPSFYADAAR